MWARANYSEKLHRIASTLSQGESQTEEETDGEELDFAPPPPRWMTKKDTKSLDEELRAARVSAEQERVRRFNAQREDEIASLEEQEIPDPPRWMTKR